MPPQPSCGPPGQQISTDSWPNNYLLVWGKTRNGRNKPFQSVLAPWAHGTSKQAIRDLCNPELRISEFAGLFHRFGLLDGLRTVTRHGASFQGL